MGAVKGDVFRFDTVTIQKEGTHPPEYRVFTVPIAVESQLPDEAEGNTQHEEVPSTASTMPQDAISIRMPFKGLIQKTIPEIEKRMGVRMGLTVQNDSLLLIANGERGAEAIEEMLNICRRSKVYNYYLCFPVRGKDFHINFDELKRQVKDCIGTSVAFERRPHVTLALLNLVTDSDLDAVVKVLQGTTLAVSALSLDEEGNKRPYTVTLSGVKSIKYKGKLAGRSVFMTSATPEDTLMDIASEFQDSVKATVNKILLESHKRLSKKSHKKRDSTAGIGTMTEAEAAAHGVHVTRGGNIEITYTDIATVDPNGAVNDEQFNRMVAELHHKYSDFVEESDGKHPKKRDPPNKHDSVAVELQRKDVGAEGEEDTVDKEVESDNEEFLEHETSVTNEFHVTLLRNHKVDKLKGIPFDCEGHVTCVELRPRGKETCSFKAYTKKSLIQFVGSRYDGKKSDRFGLINVVGSGAPDMAADLLTDPAAPQAEDKSERFVFWL
ncbi:hypothetical protein BgAZ_500220 [Babesia gibsoni]|uniref:Uncharacterized protein n=1 Tax=Babesia gibsoni TaxID=33632 RepID=A0AAD8P7K2_BABGI|nr:hypothetical protein BgAZ_500220 [Babesia gibsoni]